MTTCARPLPNFSSFPTPLASPSFSTPAPTPSPDTTAPSPLQVKHDDLREAASNFSSELQHGKEYLADVKVQQQETLKANCANINEELALITASLSQVWRAKCGRVWRVCGGHVLGDEGAWSACQPSLGYRMAWCTGCPLNVSCFDSSDDQELYAVPVRSTPSSCHFVQGDVNPLPLPERLNPSPSTPP